MATLDFLLEKMESTAQVAISKNLQVPPTLAFCSSDEARAEIAVMPWNSAEERASYLEIARGLLRDRNAVRYVAASEAWVASYPGKPGASLPDVMPRDRPDRREVIIVVGVDTSPNRVEMRIYGIDRESKTIQLLNGYNAAGGDLVGLLSDDGLSGKDGELGIERRTVH